MTTGSPDTFAVVAIDRNKLAKGSVTGMNAQVDAQAEPLSNVGADDN